MSAPVALTIAGSDSGGGAGIQADLAVFRSFGVFGTSAITAVTAQNTEGVTAWAAIGADLVRAQISAVAQDLTPRAVKTGMLGTRDVALVVAEILEEHTEWPYVLDPVLVATSGDALASPEVVSIIRDRLMPRATLVTPNLDEVFALTGQRPQTLAGMKEAARALLSAGARAVLVKGGHMESDTMFDVMADLRSMRVLDHMRINSTSTHGTGCALSAAITAQLAHGAPLDGAVERAIRYVSRAIEAAPGLGRGHGPLNFNVSTD